MTHTKGKREEEADNTFIIQSLEKPEFRNLIYLHLKTLQNSFHVMKISEVNILVLTPDITFYIILHFTGIFFVIPCIESYQKVDLRTITLGVPPQEVSKCFQYIEDEKTNFLFTRF